MLKHLLVAALLLPVPSITFTKVIETPRLFQNNNTFGYVVRGDSVEFVFGEQKMINVSGLEFVLDKRRAEIKQVNLAGDFNGWDPKNPAFLLKKSGSKLYKIVFGKQQIGKRGEQRQFKFVLNEKFWIEPPSEATNKITGKDGYTNLTIQF